MPSRFLNNININDEYSLPSADGSADQIITTDGAGQLSFVDQGTIAAESAEVVEVPVKNVHTATILKGTPVYIFGSVGSSGRLEVKPADASVAGSMPALGLLKQDLAVNAEGFCVISGKLRNLITSPIDGVTTNDGDVVYVKAGGGLTTTKPTGSANLIQNMGKVGVSSTSNNGTFVVSSILRSNDVPNLPEGKIWVGSAANTIESATVYLDEANTRMGIGTTSPDHALDVVGSLNNTLKLTSSQTKSQILFEDTNTTDTVAIGSEGDNFNIRADLGDIRFQAGSERMRITSSGNVGIGTTSPDYKLEVEGAIGVSRTDGIIFAGSAGTGTGNKITSDTSNNFIFSTSLASIPYTTSEKMRILNDGNVGIGTSSPQQKLTVSATDTTQGFSTGAFRFNAASNYGASKNILFHRQDANQVVVNEDGADLDFRVEGSSDDNLFKVDAGLNNVGIGTSGPSYKLDVNGVIRGEQYLRLRDTSGTNRFSVRSETTYSTIDNGTLALNYIANTHAFLRSSTEIMRIHSNNNVGIGTTSPSSKLEVNGEIDANGGDGYRIETKPFANWGSDLLTLGDWDGEGYATRIMGSNSSEVMRVTGSNVGIGTTAPGAKLEVNGDTKIIGSLQLYQGSTSNRYLITFQSFNATFINTGTTGETIFIGAPSAFQSNVQVQGDIIARGGSSSTSIQTQSSLSVVTNKIVDSGSSYFNAGNVGIGTTSPTQKLDVAGDARVEGRIYSNATALSSVGILGKAKADGWAARFDSNGSNLSGIYFDGNHDSSLYLRDDQGNVNVLLQSDFNSYINGGNVGIGTTSPSYKLDVDGEARFGDNGGILLTDDSGTSYVRALNNHLNLRTTRDADDIYFSTGTTTTTKMFIEGDTGNVGIGTTSLSEKLEVNGHVKAVDGYKGYVSYFHNAGFFHNPRSTDGANPLWIPINTTAMSSSDQYYNTWVPLYAGRVRKIILKHISGSTPVATVCTFYKRINGTTSGTTYTGTVTGGGAVGMKVTFDFGTSNFTFNAEDEVQIGVVTGVATQPRMGGMSCQIWYEYNIT